MNFCKLLECEHYINDTCANKAEYVDKDTGERVCKHNSKAIKKSEYKKGE